jgi:hypothetical protein
MNDLNTDFERDSTAITHELCSCPFVVDDDHKQKFSTVCRKFRKKRPSVVGTVDVNSNVCEASVF